MSGISTSINIQDKMTGTLNRITASLYNTTSAFEGVDRASDTAFNAGAIQSVTQELYRYENEIQDIQGQLDSANIKIDEMENGTRNVSKAGEGAGSIFKKLGGIIAAIGIGTFLVTQGKAAIEYASDLNEVQNVVDTTFGQNSVIDSWAKTTIDSYGLSELAAKQYAGTVGAMLKSSGITKGLNEMSMGVTALAGDMASFYNLDTDDAFSKIRSGISGETEPLKQLGINMSVANLEAYRMAQGIEVAYSDMDQASQMTLRYNYLLQATADAQGDFADTSDSYANQTRILTQNWQDFTGQIASYALPMLAQIMQQLNGFITNMQAYIPYIVAFGANVVNVIVWIAGIVGQIVNFIIQNWNVIGPLLAIVLGVLGAWAVANGIVAATQAVINAVMSACPLVWILMAIIAVIAAIYLFCQHLAETSEVASSAFGVMTGGINVVIQFFKNLGLEVANIALGIWNVLCACASNMGVAFNNVICNIQSWFYDLLSTALTVVEGICKSLNKLPFVDFDYSGISDAADDYAAKSAEAAANKGEYQSLSRAFENGMDTFSTFESGWEDGAFAEGASWGDGVSDKIGVLLEDMVDPSTLTMADAPDTTVDTAIDMSAYDAYDTSGLDTTYTAAALDDMASSSAKTAANTAAIADSVDISNENLKYLRDMAETEAVNRFTTAEIKVEMTNNNTISSDNDLDGIITNLSDGVGEAMMVAAEGVY